MNKFQEEFIFLATSCTINSCLLKDKLPSQSLIRMGQEVQATHYTGSGMTPA